MAGYHIPGTWSTWTSTQAVARLALSELYNGGPAKFDAGRRAQKAEKWE